MNVVNPHQFEKITEKILRLVLENIKGTPAYHAKEMLKLIDFCIKRK